VFLLKPIVIDLAGLLLISINGRYWLVRRRKLIASCQRSKHIVSFYGPPDPFEHKFTHRLDFHNILDLRQHARANQDLSWLGLIAQARGNIGYRPDGGIIEAAFKGDGAKRSKTDGRPPSRIVPRHLWHLVYVDRRVPPVQSNILEARAELISDKKLPSDNKSLFDTVPFA